MKPTIEFAKGLKIHQILFYVYLVFLPWQTRILYTPESAYVSWYFNYHLAFFYYLTDILLISCFTAWLLFERPLKKPNEVVWLSLTLILLGILGLFHVKHTNLALYQTLKWAEMLFLLVYVSHSFTKEVHFKIVIWILFLVSMIQAAIGITQFHVQHMIGGLVSDYIAPLGTSGLATIMTPAGKIIRAYGTMPHPNILGGFLVLGLICGFYLVSRETASHSRESGNLKNGPRIKSGVVLLGLILIILGIFVTFSRVAWLASALAMTSFMVYYLLNKQKTAVVAIVATGVVASGLILGFYHETLQARVSDGNPASIRDRASFNRVGIEAVKNYPLLGVGAGNYIPWMTENYKLEPWQYQPPHNIFIFTAAELGLLGLGVFLALIWKIFSDIKKIAMEPLPFALVTAGMIFILMSQFDHYFVTIQQGRLIFFTVLGLLAALPNLETSKPNDQSPKI